MIKILSIAILSTLIYAETPIYKGLLKSGFALGLNNQQPTMVEASIEQYGNCNILGHGKLQNNRVHVELTNMTCYKNKKFSQYRLERAFLIDTNDKISGLKTKHIVPTEDEVKILDQYEKLYKNNMAYKHQILMAKLGHWDVNGNTNVLVCFTLQPSLIKTTSETNSIVFSGNYGL